MRFHRLAFAAAGATLAAAPLSAQVPLTPRALGMGGAYVGVARGHESLWQNPANLGLPNSPHWSAGIPTLSLGLGTRGIETGDLQDLIEYNDLSEQERADLLAEIPAGGTGFDADLRAPLVALQVRRFAVGLSYQIVGSHTVNKSIVDLVLNGFDPQNTYTIDNTAGTRAAFWDIAAAYGHRVGPVSVGATAHYYIPRELVRSALVDVDTTFSVVSGFRVPTDIQVTYAGVGSTGGNGFGVDLGVAAEPIPGLTLSAAVDNVFKSVEWSDDLRVRTVTLNADDYQNGDPETLQAEYEDSEREYNQAVDAVQPFGRLADSVLALRDQGLPTVLRAGAAYRLGTGTTLAAAFQSELDDSPAGALWDQQLSFGVQQKIPLITLRAGLATDMEDGSLLSGGLSLGPIQLGVARVTSGSGDDERSGWIATFGLGGRSDTTMR
ncbi:DUF5723 family protein [Longimicrobium sp.]|uniref:DUF5723 family protein n=1 Tax=Longimicrobium sp. TaxID=2029185 RepID=UPI003B3BA46A